MKLSNDRNIIANIFITLLFFLGLLLLIKVGIYNWIFLCHFLYFALIRDDRFINMINLDELEKDIFIYAILWFICLIMPFTLILMYVTARITGYSMEDDE